MDAMGTQTEIVRLIRQKKVDYVVTLKKNHPTLYKQVKAWFETARSHQFSRIEVSENSRTETAHPERRNQKSLGGSSGGSRGTLQTRRLGRYSDYCYSRTLPLSVEQNHS